MAFALSGYQTRAHQENQWSDQRTVGRIGNRLYNKTCQPKGHYTQTSLTTALVSPPNNSTLVRSSSIFSSNISTVKEKATKARESIRQLIENYAHGATSHLPLND